MYVPADIISSTWLSKSLLLVLMIPLMLLFIYIFVKFHFKHDPHEPSYVQPYIPFIGHILGMIRYGAKYFYIVK